MLKLKLEPREANILECNGTHPLQSARQKSRVRHLLSKRGTTRFSCVPEARDRAVLLLTAACKPCPPRPTSNRRFCGKAPPMVSHARRWLLSLSMTMCSAADTDWDVMGGMKGIGWEGLGSSLVRLVSRKMAAVVGSQCRAESSEAYGWCHMPVISLSGSVTFMPTRSIFGGRSHCRLIFVHWGILGKGLKRAFRRCRVRGGSGTTFFRKLAVTVDSLGFFCQFWSGFRQTAPHPYPHYRVRFFLGGGGGRGTLSPYFGGGKFKKECFGEGGDSGRAVRGQNYEKSGSGHHY